MTATTELDPKLLKAKRKAANQLLKTGSTGNVLAVGIGQKIKDGEEKATKCIRIYVQSKLPPADLPSKDDNLRASAMLPKTFEGFTTDVIEIGRFGRAGVVLKQPPQQGPGSPIRLDTAASNVNSRATGTWGAVVQYGAKNNFILSCNHILSVNGRVPPGTKIVSGALCGVGMKPLPIATFPGEGYFVEIGTDPNAVDCALARLKEAPANITPVKLESPQRGTRVTKVGAASSTTHGIIVDTHADVSVDYSFGSFRFNNQILIKGIVDNGQQTEFAVDGDSGAIVVDDVTGAPIGMVFGEAGEYAVACPLTKVLARLGETLKKAPDLQDLESSLSIVKLA